MRCRVPVLLDCNGIVSKATVLDIGLHGLRLVTPGPLSKGARLSVGLPPEAMEVGGPLLCKVIWVAKAPKSNAYQVGALLDDTDENKARSWIRPVLARLGFSKGKIRERRLDLRVAAESSIRVAVMSTHGDFLADGRLVDLSRGGTQVSIETQIESGTNVQISIGPLGKLAQLDVPGVVLSYYRDVANQRHFHRVKFHSLSTPVVRLLRQYLRTLLHEAGEE